jgi:hypothetical protein
MPVSISPLNEQRLSELQSLLKTVFRVDESAGLLDSRLLRWKYWTPVNSWDGSRSMVLENDGVIAAHGGCCPLRFTTGEAGKAVSSVQVIDWASDNTVPGGGLLIQRHVLRLCDTLLAIGGSEDTLKLIPQVKWFRPLPPCLIYGRPLRPFRMRRRSTTIREAGRTLRNVKWSLFPVVRPSPEWTWHPITKFSAPFAMPFTGAMIERTADELNYMLDCPGATFVPLLVSRKATVCGHALLSLVHGQCRIVDLVVADPELDTWSSALASLLGWIRTETPAAEVSVGSSLEMMQQVFTDCGFRRRGARAVFMADPAKKLAEITPVEINFLIGDSAYLGVPDNPFLC